MADITIQINRTRPVFAQTDFVPEFNKAHHCTGTFKCSVDNEHEISTALMAM